jgi:oligopeptide/dipeptide ABC transporter ATP-binding protein
VTSALGPPAGCVFHTRCPVAVERCARDIPALREIRPGHWAACHLA